MKMELKTHLIKTYNTPVGLQLIFVKPSYTFLHANVLSLALFVIRKMLHIKRCFQQSIHIWMQMFCRVRYLQLNIVTLAISGDILKQLILKSFKIRVF